MKILNAFARNAKDVLDAIVLAEYENVSVPLNNQPYIYEKLANWGDIESPQIVGDKAIYKPSERLKEWRKTVKETREEVEAKVKSESEV